MKNVLFISINDHVPWGGSEELWSKTALQLSKNGFKISVLAKKWPEQPEVFSEFHKNGIEVFYKPQQNNTNANSIKSRLRRKIKKESFNPFGQDLDLGSYDIVIFSLGYHLDHNIFKYTDILRSNNIGFAIINQLVTDLVHIPDDLIKRFKNTYRDAEKVFLLSDDNAQKLEILFGEKLNNKCIINNPFNFSQDLIPLEKNDHQTIFNMAVVATLTCFHKSQDLLISVLGQDKWKNRNWKLNLYGKGENYEQLQRLVSLYGLNEKVQFHGFVENKSSIWSQNSCLILPSRMEGQSLAMLEALSTGRMVISTKVGDAERLIEDSKTGFLINSVSFKEIDETLEKAWNKRDSWIDMGILGRKFLFENIKEDPIDSFSNKIKAIVD